VGVPPFFVLDTKVGWANDSPMSGSFLEVIFFKKEEFSLDSGYKAE